MMKKTEWKEYEVNGWSYRIRATYGIDYDFGHQHNQAPHFSITGEIEHRQAKTRGPWREDSGGCLHEEIAKHFPELASLVKWHLSAVGQGPMHYEANAMFWWEHAIGLREFTSYDRVTGSPVEEAMRRFEHTVVYGGI